jgi:hypothetical protein
MASPYASVEWEAELPETASPEQTVSLPSLDRLFRQWEREMKIKLGLSHIYIYDGEEGDCEDSGTESS